MRRARRGVVLAACLALAAACRDATGSAERTMVATLTGRWAGQPWAGSAGATLFAGPSGDTLFVGGSSPPGSGAMPRQSLRLWVVPFRGVGTYEIPPQSVAFVDLLGGDAMVRSYGGRRPVAGTLVVTAYDAASGEITGTLRLDAEPAYGTPIYGPVASFEDGRFRATAFRYAPPAAER